MKFDFKKNTYEVVTWDGEYLGNHVAIDCETDVRPFHTTPDLATVMAYGGDERVFYIPLSRLNEFLKFHFDSKLIMHNAPFDVDVIEKHINKKGYFHYWYDRNLIYDTGILYRLQHLAIAGFVPFKHSLGMLTEKFMGYTMNKEGDVRTSFIPYRNAELKNIPDAHIEYAALDVICTFSVCFTLLSLIQDVDKMKTLLSMHIQVKGDLALNHIYKNGIGFDLKKRDVWLKDMDDQIAIVADILATYGWVRGVKGINDKYELIMKHLGLEDKLPRTKDGKLSSAGEDLQPFKDNNFVAAYLQYIQLEKDTNFVRNIESERVHPRYQTLVNTGRTSCSKPNFQNLPRAGEVRSMFKAKEGHTLIITDYSSLELCVLAQVTYEKFGHSVMKDLINEGRDLHRYAASQIYNKEEKDVTKEERQLAKILNFGLGANMGHTTFVDYAAGYGVTLAEEQSFQLKEMWKNIYPEMVEFFKVPNPVPRHYTRTGRARGECTYTAYLNGFFQGPSADGLKLALYELDKLGMKIVGEVHDEIISEVPIEKAEEMLALQEKIMIEQMEVITPDVTIRVESDISPRYKK